MKTIGLAVMMAVLFASTTAKAEDCDSVCKKAKIGLASQAECDACSKAAPAPVVRRKVSRPAATPPPVVAPSADAKKVEDLTKKFEELTKKVNAFHPEEAPPKPIGMGMLFLMIMGCILGCLVLLGGGVLLWMARNQRALTLGALRKQLDQLGGSLAILLWILLLKGVSSKEEMAKIQAAINSGQSMEEFQKQNSTPTPPTP